MVNLESQIQITVDKKGAVNMMCSNQNQMTNLKILNIAMNLVLKNQPDKKPSRIINLNGV